MSRWLSVLLLGSLTIGCEFSTEAPGEVLSQPISGGQVDLEHQSVFALMVHHNDYASFCTSTLIAPNLLLTARHCVSEGGSDEVVCGASEFTNEVPGDTIFSTNDPVPAEDSPWFRGLDVRVPEEGNDTCGFDMALIILSSSVPPSVATPAIPRIDLPVQEGESYVAIGYGNTSDVDNTGGTRMILDELEVQCAPGACRSTAIESTEFLGETGICSGDSGGPALDMNGKVVGVVSRGSDGCETPIYGTVSAWRDWLMASAVDAAAIGGYAAPYWATSGSSDAPVVDHDPPEPLPEGGGDGHACSQPADCLSGFACYFDADPADAVCRSSCSATSDCTGGLTCHSFGNGGGVCLQPDSDGADESGCSVVTDRCPSGGLSLSALVLAALVPLRRLRRRRAV